MEKRGPSQQVKRPRGHCLEDMPPAKHITKAKDGSGTTWTSHVVDDPVNARVLLRKVPVASPGEAPKQKVEDDSSSDSSSTWTCHVDRTRWVAIIRKVPKVAAAPRVEVPEQVVIKTSVAIQKRTHTDTWRRLMRVAAFVEQRKKSARRDAYKRPADVPGKPPVRRLQKVAESVDPIIRRTAILIEAPNAPRVVRRRIVPEEIVTE